LITFGGTLGTVVTAFPVYRLKTFGSVIKKAFQNEKFDLERDIEIIVELNDIVKKRGCSRLNPPASSMQTMIFCSEASR
jgi:flagellar motor component MotA